MATAANLNNKDLTIYHVGSSDRNPVTWAELEPINQKYWNSNVSINRLKKANAFLSVNKAVIGLHRLKHRVPLALYSKIAPYLGNQHVKKAERMSKGF